MSSASLLSVLNDSLLALVLFVLFLYVSRLSRQVRGVFAWGAAHLVYTVGATVFDAGTAAARAAGLTMLARLCPPLGALMACVGMAGLACAMALFVRQQPLRRGEWLLLALAAAMPLVLDAVAAPSAQNQSLVGSELVGLALILWHLRRLDRSPYRLPAWVMMAGSALLLVLYGSTVPGWLQGRYGYDEVWVGADLALWHLLNFCVLMLSSFRAAESLRRTAQHDPLTDALNRRGLEAELRDVDPGLRVRDVSVIAMDLDHFKRVNDRHGHAAGDAVLQRFAETVRACIRIGDLFARVGGEEFVLVLRGIGIDDVRNLAERIRRGIAQQEIAPIAPDRITVSAGIARADDELAFGELMARADEALYAAKHAGRNRVLAWQRAA